MPIHSKSRGDVVATPGAMPETGKYRIIVCVPTHAMVPYQFAFDLANMIGYTIAAIGDKVDIITNVMAGTYVHKAREQLLNEALGMGCHYMLWLDSDMRFPKDLLVRLLAHDEKMVGINYSTRGIPPRFVAIKRIGVDHKDDGLGGALCPTWEESTGLEEVEAIGFGAVLMKAEIAVTLPENEPVFWFGYSDDMGTHVGEDVWFCRMVRQYNPDLKILLDHDLSKECAHCGHLEYRVEHAQVMLEEGAKAEGGERGDHLVYGATDGDSELAESERPVESGS